MHVRCLFILFLIAALTLPPVWAASPNFVRVVATGDNVPGGEPGEVFADLEQLALVSGHCVVFKGLGDMGSAGIYLLRGQDLEIVVDLETPVPGGEPSDAFTALDTFSVDFCDVAYGATVNDVTTAIFHKSPDQDAQRIVDTATSVPSEPGEVFSEVEAVWLHYGDMAFLGRYGHCQGSVQTVDGVYFFDGGTLAVSTVADTCSTALPGGQPGEIFGDAGGDPIVDAGSLVFAGGGDMGSEGIYTTLGGPLRRVADFATTVPGGQPGEVFNDFSEAVSISHGEIIFLAGGTMGSIGIFRETTAGLELLYDVSETPPGWLPGEVFDFENHEDEAIFAWHSGGVTTFYGIGNMGSEGIYRTNGNEVTKLIAVGDDLDATTVTGLFFIVHAKSERVVFVAELDDTMQAVFVTREVLFEDGFESGDLSAWS